MDVHQPREYLAQPSNCRPPVGHHQQSVGSSRLFTLELLVEAIRGRPARQAIGMNLE